jgi:hypothetical protein
MIFVLLHSFSSLGSHKVLRIFVHHHTVQKDQGGGKRLFYAGWRVTRSSALEMKLEISHQSHFERIRSVNIRVVQTRDQLTTRMVSSNIILEVKVSVCKRGEFRKIL